MVCDLLLHSSKNAIRTIYHNENDLFVSGTDEIIHMYNIHNKESNGDLVTYSGSINDIKIVKNWLIAAGDENNIPLWRMSDFSNVINLKGHKSSINSFDVHNKGGFSERKGLIQFSDVVQTTSLDERTRNKNKS